MSISFPTFIDKEIVSPEKLNAFVQALEAKFTAGLGSAEIQWPLIAGGNIVLGDYEITGGAKIWKVVNAGAYTTFAAALIAGAGGCVFIPPNTTIDVDGDEMSGSSVTIIGAGPTSVIRLQSGASAGWLLRNVTAGASIRMANLVLDGNDESTNDGLVLRGATKCDFSGVTFQNFGGAAFKMTVLGGSATTHVKTRGCRFRDGAGNHIFMDDVTDIEIVDNKFYGATDIAVLGVPAGGTSHMSNVKVDENQFTNCTDEFIKIIGATGTWSALWSDISVCDNTLDTVLVGAGKKGITVGLGSAWVQNIKISDNIMPGAIADAITVYARYGVIHDNMIQNAGGDGIDMLSSEEIVVSGNNCRNAGAYGIDFVDTVNCNITDNDCDEATTAPFLICSSITDPSVHHGNSSSLAEVPQPSAFFTLSSSLTIPANTLRVGDVMRVHTMADDTAATASYLTVQSINAFSWTGVGSGAAWQYEINADLVITGTTIIQSMFNVEHEGQGDPSYTNITQSTGYNLAADMKLILTGGIGDAKGFMIYLHRAEIQ